MKLDISEMVLSGYEKISEEGFTFPVYTQHDRGNLRFRALSEIANDYVYRITGFEEIETGHSYCQLPEVLMKRKQRGDIWTDIFLWGKDIHVGSRVQIYHSVRHLIDDIKITHPLTLMDLIQDPNRRIEYKLVESAFSYLLENHSEEKAIDWITENYLRNEVLNSYRVASKNIGLSKLEQNAIGHIKIERKAKNIGIVVPRLSDGLRLNPLNFPRVKIAQNVVTSILTEHSIDFVPSFSFSSSNPRVLVVGVGGAGVNIINSIIEGGLSEVSFLAINTDTQSLASSKAKTRINIGRGLTLESDDTLGSEFGKRCARENVNSIVSEIESFDMLFIVAGMGGLTGTGAIQVIAQEAQNLGILTVAVVSKPFQFEGGRRSEIAEIGIKELSSVVDTIITIPNQNLFRIATEKVSMGDAFALMDETILNILRTIMMFITESGLVNIDFTHISKIFRKNGRAMIGFSEAKGDRRAIHAAEGAILNPLLDDISIRDAKSVLISISGGDDMTLYEIDEAVSLIKRQVDPGANIKFGSVVHKGSNGLIQVSVVATGMDGNGVGQEIPPNKSFMDITKQEELDFELNIPEFLPKAPHSEQELRSSPLQEIRSSPFKFWNRKKKPTALQAQSVKERNLTGDLFGPDVEEELEIPFFLRRNKN